MTKDETTISKNLHNLVIRKLANNIDCLNKELTLRKSIIENLVQTNRDLLIEIKMIAKETSHD